MAIATLIAAGRLDDRLVDRALGLLRELDPRRAFAHWIDEGDAADLRFAGDVKAARWALDGARGRRCRRPARRAALAAGCSSPTWIRPSSARNASTSSPIMPGSRTRSRAITERAMQGELDFPGALRERVRLLAGLDERELSRCLDERVQPDRGRGDPGPDDARRRRELPARLGRLPVLRRAGRANGRLRPGQGQSPGLRRRQAERRGRRPDRRRHGQARRADRGPRRARACEPRTCSRSATAPTTC